jgi:hypothetical protein
MFRSRRRRFCWPRMAVNVADTVRQCDVCSCIRIKERTWTSSLKLFPASSPLTYMSIDILGPLPKTNHGNRFLLVMTDRFKKLTRTVPLRSTSTCAVAKTFRPLGVHLRSTLSCPEEQRSTIRVEALPRNVPRARDRKLLFFCITSPNEWASRALQHQYPEFPSWVRF